MNISLAPRLGRTRPFHVFLALACLSCLITGFILLGGGPEPLLVLAYHRVTRASSGPVPAVPPAEFARQLAYLRKAGYRSIDPDELRVCLEAARPFPRRAVLITFDDGWADNFTEAWPLLRVHGFVATVFVVSGRVGKRDYLTAGQLSTLGRAGWTIGAHTVTHPHLPALSPAEARAEILGSRLHLVRLIQGPVTCFAYPYGDYSPAVRDLVGEAGFTTAFSTRLGSPRSGQDRLALKRLTMPRHGGWMLLVLASSPWLKPFRVALDHLLCTGPFVKAQEAYSRFLWRPARRPPPPVLPFRPSPRPQR